MLIFILTKVGDIVKVKADEIIPCDLVLLYANTAERKCYIQTANLDGETNLKVICFLSFFFLADFMLLINYFLLLYIDLDATCSSHFAF